MDIFSFIDAIENQKAVDQSTIKAICKLLKAYRSAIQSINKVDPKELNFDYALKFHLLSIRALQKENEIISKFKRLPSELSH